MDEKEYIESLTKSANKVIAEAQYNLGMMYFGGISVEQDDKKAFDWYLKSAEQGNAVVNTI
jgi:TPR repeat protein